MSEEDFRGFNGQDRVILNCGGVRHETFLSTLRNFPETRLTWSVENAATNRDYDSEKKEFFFDRHPGVFAQILNFYRTGKLHAPHDVCGPLFQDELMYWGIDEKQMEPCCWSFYTQHREAQESLKAFEGIDASDNESDDELGNSGGWTQDTSKWQKYKVQVWNMFENHRSSKMAKTIFGLSLGFIILSVLAYILQTLPNIVTDKSAKLSLTVLETICSVWFTIEFVVRLVVCPNKKNFFKEPMNWIDLISILPVFVRIIEKPHAYPYDNPSLEYDILAAVRLFRLFRFFKVNLGFLILKQTMIASSRELLLLVLLVLIPVVIFASFAYICERDKNKDQFESIPDGLWWAIITITTVGYGDSSPKTLAGKIFASFCALASIIITALPISIIGNNFSLYYSHAQAKMKLPKKSQRNLIGAANALMIQSSRRSDEISVEEIPINESEKPHEGMNGSADGSHPPSNIRRARRARSSLYAGGVVPRMSLPARVRSTEDIGENDSSPPELRKKSYTSTQTTTIDTPPKSPPHFGNTLTVSQSDISENILDMSCPDFGDTRIVHNEADEFGLDDIDRAVARVDENDKKDKANGFPRPGTPVKRSVKHSVRFVKPTLTVTMLTPEAGSVNDAFVEELKEEPSDDPSQDTPILMEMPNRPISPSREEIKKKEQKGYNHNRGRR